MTIFVKKLSSLCIALLWIGNMYSADGHTLPVPPATRCPGCPYFLQTPQEIRTTAGIAANLTCGVRMIGDKQVSWIRRRDLHVLTTDGFKYTSDNRFKVFHADSSPYWILRIETPTEEDSGVYECQISTQPKVFRPFKFEVVVPHAVINSSKEMFMQAGSDINITCIVKGTSEPTQINWFHDPVMKGETRKALNSGRRGGIQLVTDLRASQSWLLVANATWKDAGNYTCSVDKAEPAIVSVHVIDEETPAAMHGDEASRGTSNGRENQ